ncbi:MAG: hypothetical protein AAFQ47_09460 [Pseudomonadota bacterium]
MKVRYASDLATSGFEPFAVTDEMGALFGMKRSTDMYMCFSVDTASDNERRWSELSREIGAQGLSTSVPAIPVACVEIR